jgi:hypothetical protein
MSLASKVFAEISGENTRYGKSNCARRALAGGKRKDWKNTVGAGIQFEASW